MFPVLVLVYRRLAISEERETRARFGAGWDAYAARTPRFVLRFTQRPMSTPAPVGGAHGRHHR